MEQTLKQRQKNLLSNSLTVRLRQSDDNNRAVQHQHNSRRQSLKHLIHLKGLKVSHEHDVRSHDLNRKRYNSYSQDQSPVLIQKGSPNVGQKPERERSVIFDPSLRTRSDLSSMSLLPRLAGSESSMSQVSIKEEFPQFAFIDKDDLSHVKVFKLKGIFQPQNKYFNKIEPIEISQKVQLPSTGVNDGERAGKSPSLAEERTGTGSPNDAPKSRMSRMSRKGLRVSWSRRSQYYSADDDFDDNQSIKSPAQSDIHTPKPDGRAESREESVKTPSTTKSFSMKSESFFVKKSHGKRQVNTIGLKWTVPAADIEKPEESIRKPVRRIFGNLSHNLMPVTKALDKSGLSANKMRWRVQTSDSLRKAKSYQNWVDQLVDLKAGRLETVVDKIPNRANLSVMTQPVK